LTSRSWKFLVPCVLLLFGLAATFLSCSDDTNEDNSIIVPELPLPVVFVKDTLIYATAGSTYKQFGPMDGRYNLIGEEDGYTAMAAVAFYPSSFPLIDTLRVVSARLHLHMYSWYGDNSGALRFTAHKILRSWSSYSLLWDTVQAAFYDPTARGTFSGTGGPDTQTVSLTLDTSLVREWFSSSTEATKYGVMLVPEASSRVARGFHAFGGDSTKWNPTLEVTARNYPGATQETTLVFQSGVDTFVGNIDNLSSNPDLLYVQAGVNYRSIVNFNVSFIPRGATVLLAEMFLDRDPVTSRLSTFSGDSSIAAHLALSAANPPLFEAIESDGRRMDGTAYTYKLEMTRAAQAWVRGPNYGAVLRRTTPGEFETFDLLTFHSPTASPATVRPRMKITYSWRTQ